MPYNKKESRKCLYFNTTFKLVNMYSTSVQYTGVCTVSVNLFTIPVYTPAYTQSCTSCEEGNTCVKLCLNK